MTAPSARWRALPMAELHLHLRGAMPVAIFTDLLNQYADEPVLARLPGRHRARFPFFPNIRPFLEPGRRWTVAETTALFQYADFDQFLATFAFTGYFIRAAADLRRLIDGVLADLRAQGVVYVELTFSLPEYLRQGLTIEEIGACLAAATATPGIRVQWIIDLVRDFGHEAGLTLLEEVIALNCPAIVGITLGGSEHLFPPAPFAAVYARARAAGLRLTVHAGEALGPRSVWDALNLLGVERIGHGIRAIEDPALVAHLATRGVPLEVCPTSNLRTGIVASHAAHPVRALHAAGVALSINSDDPTFFGATLADEYAALESLGVPEATIVALIANGFRHAFLPEAERAAYLARVDAAWRAARA
jgi:adenosine deaminase